MKYFVLNAKESIDPQSFTPPEIVPYRCAVLQLSSVEPSETAVIIKKKKEKKTKIYNGDFDTDSKAREKDVEHKTAQNQKQKLETLTKVLIEPKVPPKISEVSLKLVSDDEALNE